ncbi:hypothetical protein [Winogradskyella alexanderae]|uniref:DUF4468 domain-containing protein n=1 Tax=Winogradskyella alexanderae TaxID=2877123 RepID=A0ABS7XQG5_9FLAO|nr:hypothetical protein [Winogradskyella alexanderae]MCA0132015.1 hypothetical protein [Winogradskyella alexanderae]
MKQLLLCLCVLISSLVFSQEQFVITEDGLSPRFIAIDVESNTYTKVLDWLVANMENYDITIVETIENKSIQFTSEKGNATNLDKQYFNAKYGIILHFTTNQFTFEPTAIDLKQNSKYDMGWKPIDLNAGAPYFKNGKPIRKFRAYLYGIVAPLNSLSLKLMTN